MWWLCDYLVGHLSHLCIVKTSERILKLFQGKHTILVFHPKFCGNIPTGTPNGGIEYKWGMKKNIIFEQYLALSQK